MGLCVIVFSETKICDYYTKAKKHYHFDFSSKSVVKKVEGHEGYEVHTDRGHGGSDFAQLVSNSSGFSTAEILRIHHADRDYPNPNLLDCIAQKPLS